MRCNCDALYFGTDGFTPGQFRCPCSTCVAPVLDMNEAPSAAQNVARGTFVEIDGVIQPAPAPRMSVTPGQAGRIPAPGEHTLTILADLGFSEAEVDSLRADGVC